MWDFRLQAMTEAFSLLVQSHLVAASSGINMRCVFHCGPRVCAKTGHKVERGEGGSNCGWRSKWKGWGGMEAGALCGAAERWHSEPNEGLHRNARRGLKTRSRN